METITHARRGIYAIGMQYGVKNSSSIFGTKIHPYANEVRVQFHTNGIALQPKTMTLNETFNSLHSSVLLLLETKRHRYEKVS